RNRKQATPTTTYTPRTTSTYVPALANLPRSTPLVSTRGSASSNANATLHPSNVRRAVDRRAHGMRNPNTLTGMDTDADAAGSATKAGGLRESGTSLTGAVLMRAAIEPCQAVHSA